MDYNYHTHTFRCSHADGTAEEYIKNAIEGGIKYMGFSDHIPFVRSDGLESWYRIPFSEGKEYCLELAELKEKYKDKIKLSIGFEMEFYEPHFSKMLNDAISFGAEYLILGQHFLTEDLPGSFHSTTGTDSEDYLEQYVSAVIDAINTDVFTYVAHPDIFLFTGDNAIYQKQMKKICVASRDRNVPLEINFLGIRDKRNYPFESFWKIAGEEGCPVTFGFDAHQPIAARDHASFLRAMDFVQQFQLNYIGKPNLRKLQKKS